MLTDACSRHAVCTYTCEGIDAASPGAGICHWPLSLRFCRLFRFFRGGYGNAAGARRALHHLEVPGAALNLAGALSTVAEERTSLSEETDEDSLSLAAAVLNQEHRSSLGKQAAYERCAHATLLSRSPACISGIPLTATFLRAGLRRRVIFLIAVHVIILGLLLIVRCVATTTTTRLSAGERMCRQECQTKWRIRLS